MQVRIPPAMTPAMTPVEQLTARITACDLCRERFAGTATAHAPRPVPWLSAAAPVLISGQAPGMQVHRKGQPFDDPSGDRLRDWMGVDRETFYDRSKIAVLPMSFCFPGYNEKGSDLPPPPVCRKTWHDAAMAAMAQVRLVLVIGGYAQSYHLGTRNVTETVANWQTHVPRYLPLPHPSWRNTGWLGKNPWFEAEVLPWLRPRIAKLIG